MRYPLLIVTLVLSASVLAACSTTPPAPQNLSMGSGPTAKLRAFDGAIIHLHPGKDCVRGSTVKQLTLGPTRSLMAKGIDPSMPITPDLPRVYHEYVIPAGVPNTVRIFAGRDCQTLPRFFIPKPGGFYDVSLQTNFWNARCDIRVRQILPTDGQTTAREIATLPAHRCQNVKH